MQAAGQPLCPRLCPGSDRSHLMSASASSLSGPSKASLAAPGVPAPGVLSLAPGRSFGSRQESTLGAGSLPRPADCLRDPGAAARLESAQGEGVQSNTSRVGLLCPHGGCPQILCGSLGRVGIPLVVQWKGLKVGQMRARAMLVPATMQQHEHESQPSMDICHSPVQLFTMLKSCHKSYALLSGRQC